MNSRIKASHVPVRSGIVHPYQKALEGLVGFSGDLAEIHKQVYEAFKGKKITPGFVGGDELMDFAAKSGVLKKLEAIADAAENVASQELKPRNYDPRPPPAVTLYSRVSSDSKLVDVGAGDGKRLVKFSDKFESIKMVDPLPAKVEGLDSRKVNVLVKNFETDDVEDNEVVTSFNAITQVGPVLEGFDGVHVAPDLVYMESIGLSKKVGDGYSTTIRGITYPDRHLVQGCKLKPGYLGVSTFKKRKIDIRVVGRVKTVAQKGTGRRLFAKRTPDYVTKKYDGIQMTIKINNGVGYIVNRKGLGYKITSDGPNMSMTVEKMSDRYVVFNMDHYNGLKPFGGPINLRRFVSSVEVKIEGLPLVAPEDVDVLDYNGFDGVVHWFGEQDFVVSKGTALDIHERDWEAFEAFLKPNETRYQGDRGTITKVHVTNTQFGYIVDCEPRNDKDKTDLPEVWANKFMEITVADLNGTRLTLGEMDFDMESDETE